MCEDRSICVKREDCPPLGGNGDKALEGEDCGEEEETETEVEYVPYQPVGRNRGPGHTVCLSAEVCFSLLASLSVSLLKAELETHMLFLVSIPLPIYCDLFFVFAPIFGSVCVCVCVFLVHIRCTNTLFLFFFLCLLSQYQHLSFT